MSKKARGKLTFGEPAAPTMIIPQGTQIETDAHGQLSIRTPGNLVVQNSGSYAVLESVSGSIRIEPNVQVEAVAVKCAETCYVQGSLTAWQVVAKTLHLDGSAQAHVMMQETERLEVDREARLVGNFHSEKELYMLFSRFARQVRSLPFGLDLGAKPVTPVVDVAPASSPAPKAPGRIPSGTASPSGSEPDELPEELFFALILLEREGDRGRQGPTSQRVIEELSKLLREGDLETLRHTHRTLFSRVNEPSEHLRKAARLVAAFFAGDRQGDSGVE